MSEAKLPIREITIETYKRIVPFIKTFPFLTLILFVLCVIESYFHNKYRLIEQGDVAAFFQYCLFTMPPRLLSLLIFYQIYRYVVFKETTFNLKRIITQRFFWLLLIIDSVLVILSNFVVYKTSVVMTFENYDIYEILTSAGMVGLFALNFYLMLKTFVMYVDIATEKQDYSLLKSFNLSNGHLWRILCVFVLSFLIYYVYLLFQALDLFNSRSIFDVILESVVNTISNITNDIAIALAYLHITKEAK